MHDGVRLEGGHRFPACVWDESRTFVVDFVILTITRLFILLRMFAAFLSRNLRLHQSAGLFLCCLPAVIELVHCVFRVLGEFFSVHRALYSVGAGGRYCTEWGDRGPRCYK